MQATIGIDVGGSTTKIVGFRHLPDGKRELISPLYVRATDPVTSAYGAFGKFTALSHLELSDIRRVLVTGVGSSAIGNSLYNLPCSRVEEFVSIGRGGLFLSGLEEAIVVSMGTGTALVHAKSDGTATYLGGTGVGGGTLVGLSKLLLKMDSIEHIQALSEEGNLANIDLRIGDIMKGGVMPQEMTAANFGNVSDLATKSDIALGLSNMIFETVGMLAIFAARAHALKDIVLTGNLSAYRTCRDTFANLSEMFGVRFLIPENSRFATVIGAALSEGDPA
ncbi:MAG: pantothenate kinase [Clostridia bacterium]|nr:pantothenate kinase [Clostridia bacterium]MDY6184055.1 pantothenate kinase [Eubacteriales bacterium]